MKILLVFAFAASIAVCNSSPEIFEGDWEGVERQVTNIAISTLADLKNIKELGHADNPVLAAKLDVTMDEAMLSIIDELSHFRNVDRTDTLPETEAALFLAVMVMQVLDCQTKLLKISLGRGDKFSKETTEMITQTYLLTFKDIQSISEGVEHRIRVLYPDVF